MTKAKAICAVCQVRQECLRLALVAHEVHGVWAVRDEEHRLLRSVPGTHAPFAAGAAASASRRGGPMIEQQVTTGPTPFDWLPALLLIGGSLLLVAAVVLIAVPARRAAQVTPKPRGHDQ